jgi:hypothetical protein
MIETQQQDDIGQRLQEAVLKAAMPAEDIEIPTLVPADKDGEKAGNEGKRAGVSPRNGAVLPQGTGRPPGVKNKLTNLRDAVLEAFDEVGGAAYLARLAQGTSSDRAAFVGLVSKVLPTQINANVEGGIQVQLSWLGGRNIGTTVAQPVEQVTQVVDLERDSAGKYRIKDPVDAVSPAAGGASAIDDQGKTAQNGAGDAQGA